MGPADGLLDHPHDVYRCLRDTAPVHRIAGTDGNPAWVVTRYQDVREALADPRLSVGKRHAKEGNYQGFSPAARLRCQPPQHGGTRPHAHPPDGRPGLHPAPCRTASRAHP